MSSAPAALVLPRQSHHDRSQMHPRPPPVPITSYRSSPRLLHGSSWLGQQGEGWGSQSTRDNNCGRLVQE
eukprot:434861-Hanusia_phi.AAC.3